MVILHIILLLSNAFLSLYSFFYISSFHCFHVLSKIFNIFIIPVSICLSADFIISIISGYAFIHWYVSWLQIIFFDFFTCLLTVVWGWTLWLVLLILCHLWKTVNYLVDSPDSFEACFTTFVRLALEWPLIYLEVSPAHKLSFWSLCWMPEVFDKVSPLWLVRTHMTHMSGLTCFSVW